MAWSKFNKSFSIFIYFCLYSCTFSLQFSRKNLNNYVRSQFRTVIDGEEIVFRVVDGRPGRLGEVPYQVAVMRNLEKEIYQAFCGGSIIRPNKVLTAAHCIAPDYDSEGKISKLVAVAGQLWTSAIFDKQGQWREVSKGLFPSSYKFPNDDIALLLLKKNFDYNLAVQPIPYATKFTDVSQVCTASGYGFVDNSKGDSGGPLVCKGTGDPAEGVKGVQVGVVCAGHNTVKMRTIFTRISRYSDFVASSSNLTFLSEYILILVLFFYGIIDLLLF